MEEVLESTRWVVEQSEQVRVDHSALARFARKLVTGELQVPQWNYHYHFYDGGELTVAYLLALDSLNFCFWAPEGEQRWEIFYKGEEVSGYYGLAAALKRAFEAGVPLDDAEFLSRLSPGGLAETLDGRGELQLLDWRSAILNELGQVLLERYAGRPCRLVEAAGGSAVALVRLLARELPSFRDEADYRGRKVCFYKRAQILTADLWCSFQGRSWGDFADIDRLTAFADYKLPQVLHHLGILDYAPQLTRKIDTREVFAAGSPEEVEIRANTVWAVELLREELGRRGRKLLAIELDWLLWGLGQQEGFKGEPYHRAVTIFY
jgi:hypothetical protein